MVDKSGKTKKNDVVTPPVKNFTTRNAGNFVSASNVGSLFLLIFIKITTVSFVKLKAPFLP